jgi:hypothetical protein
MSKTCIVAALLGVFVTSAVAAPESGRFVPKIATDTSSKNTAHTSPVTKVAVQQCFTQCINNRCTTNCYP